MRATLKPKGIKNVVLLQVGKHYNFLERSGEEVAALIDEFERAVIMGLELEEPPSELQKLGMQVLLDSLDRG